jgi:hypothetical protein
MTITLTREEAQQVLDAFAWELGGEPIGTEIQKSVDLLRARLAQPEPEYRDVVIKGDLWRIEFLPDHAASVVLVRANYEAQPEQRIGDCLLAGVCAAEGHRIQKAQPEPPWINNTQTGNFFNVAQPEPEPVAWDNCVAGLAEARLCKSWCGNFNCSATEPQRKEWQGLTDDEIIDTANNAPFDTMVSAEDYIYVIARAIEAKLKEKNA